MKAVRYAPLSTSGCGKGKKTKLSKQEGTHKAIFSNNMKYYINTFSNINTPPVITLNDNNGKELATLVDNNKLKHQVFTSEYAK